MAALPERAFVEVRDVEGPRGPVESAFSRLAAVGTLWRVRKGLYWKGRETAVGMSRPRRDEVALKIGGSGSGPAGVAAAHWLGLTSQVPSILVTAVPARAPKSWGHIRFTQRSVERLVRHLSPSEVAVIEVLRAGPSVLEQGWEEMSEVVCRLAESGDVRVGVLADQIADEHHLGTRHRWAEMLQQAPALIGSP